MTMRRGASLARRLGWCDPRPHDRQRRRQYRRSAAKFGQQDGFLPRADFARNLARSVRPGYFESSMENPRVRLGELLVRAGLITGRQLEEALAEQRRVGKRLGSLLVETGLV